MYPEFASLIAAGGHYAPLITPYQHGFSLQGGVVDNLYGNEKRIEIKMRNMSYLVISHPNLKFTTFLLA
jgi:hypothetical protein